MIGAHWPSSLTGALRAEHVTVWLKTDVNISTTILLTNTVFIQVSINSFPPLTDSERTWLDCGTRRRTTGERITPVGHVDSA